MSNGNVHHITPITFISTSVMAVPVGPAPNGGSPDVIPNIPYDFLYICTGLLAFEFHSNNGPQEGVLTFHGPNDIPGVPIMKANGIDPLILSSPRTRQPMTISASAITVSLAAIDNDQSDNGIWTVTSAKILPPVPGAIQPQPELEIHVTVQGNDAILMQGVSYSAFLQASPIT